MCSSCTCTIIIAQVTGCQVFIDGCVLSLLSYVYFHLFVLLSFSLFSSAFFFYLFILLSCFFSFLPFCVLPVFPSVLYLSLSSFLSPFPSTALLPSHPFILLLPSFLPPFLFHTVISLFRLPSLSSLRLLSCNLSLFLSISLS